MLQRLLLRQGQAARSALSHYTSATPLALRRTSQLQPRVFQAIRPVAPQQAYRCYSTEKPTDKGEEKDASKENEATETQESPEESLRKDIEKKEKEITDLKDKYVRSVADFLNLQERTKRDMDNARNFAIQRFATDLLESIDNFDRALLAVPNEKIDAPKSEENKEFVDLVAGLKMTQNIMINTLKKHGLERFDPSEPAENGKPQKFDPNLHEATFMTKAEGMEDGDIMYTQSKGFRLNGRVLRAAKVGVVKNT